MAFLPKVSSEVDLLPTTSSSASSGAGAPRACRVPRGNASSSAGSYSFLATGFGSKEGDGGDDWAGGLPPGGMPPPGGFGKGNDSPCFTCACENVKAVVEEEEGAFAKMVIPNVPHHDYYKHVYAPRARELTMLGLFIFGASLSAGAVRAAKEMGDRYEEYQAAQAAEAGEGGDGAERTSRATGSRTGSQTGSRAPETQVSGGEASAEEDDDY